MSILRRLALPLTVLFVAIALPLRRRARRRVLAKSGWVELKLAGEVQEFRMGRDVVQTFVRRLLKRTDPPRVVLSRLRTFVDEVTTDSYARGVLVRIGPIGGGWAAAAAIRNELLRIRDAGRHLVIHIESNADNRQALIASAGTRILMTPSGTMGAAGVAAPGLFLRDALDKVGLRVEALYHGKYKSAPDQFTRIDRSESDHEQTRALVDQLDEALIEGLMAGRVLNREDAEALVDAAPMVGSRAKTSGFCDDLARDEDLGDVLRTLDEREEAPVPVGAARYLSARTLPKVWPSRRHVGIVRVHGPIIDQAGRFALPDQQIAVADSVVNDLRAALADKKIGAVVLHIDSRGGSVTASDAIYSAVRRLDQDKPVIACFGDVAASGGYYVACGARTIVASPLTLTGSIGVFGLVPTWPKLTEQWNVGHDVIRNRRHAALFNPWAGLDEESRAHAQRDISAMYEHFIELVAGSRGLSRDEVEAAAQGRVWTGRDARQHRLLDDLGGFATAIELAKSEAGGKFSDDPIIVTAKAPLRRPTPAQSGAPATDASALDGSFGAPTAPWARALLESGLIGAVADPIVQELLALAWSQPNASRRILAYAPVIAPA